jgi:general secretion pathway protein G
MRRREREKTIFFPWERQASLWIRLGISRTRPIVFAAVFVSLVALLGWRERKTIGVRSTRATLAVVGKAVDRYRADHEGRCPTDLADLRREKYIDFEPVDAWKRPLRLLCPGFSHPESYDLMSDGPDGAFGGLDRVE